MIYGWNYSHISAIISSFWDFQLPLNLTDASKNNTNNKDVWVH